MSSTTKIYEEKMNNCVAHLDRELTSIRAGRANPGILDKVMVDYYGSPTPVQQVASVAVSEARILTITPWDGTLIKAISKAIQTSDIGINPIDDGHTIRLVFPAPTEERRKQLTKDVQKQGEEAKIAVRNVRVADNQWLTMAMDNQQLPANLPQKIMVQLGKEGTETYPAALDYLSPNVDLNTGTLTVRANFDNPKGILKSGSRGSRRYRHP